MAFYGWYDRDGSHRKAKLTAEQVRAMRRDYKSRNMRIKDIAERYGVSPATAAKIIRGQHYGWVFDDQDGTDEGNERPRA